MLFKVHRYFFQKHSMVFREIFAAEAPKAGVKDGSSDEHPIVIYDVSTSDFEAILWYFYHSYVTLVRAPRYQL